MDRKAGSRCRSQARPVVHMILLYILMEVYGTEPETTRQIAFACKNLSAHEVRGTTDPSQPPS